MGSVELKVLQRNLEATQAELEKTKAHLEELEEIQKTIDSRVAAQNTSLKLEYDTAKSDMNTVTKRVLCGNVW